MASEQPKKAPSAYFIFLAANRDSFAKTAGSKAAGPVAGVAAAAWKALAPAEKNKVVAQAGELKKEADKKIAAFKAAGGVMNRKRKAEKSGKKMKDKNAPKKPAGGAYGCYLAKNREAIKATLPAGHSITDVAKAAGPKFKALSAAEKKPYDEEYAKKAAEYKKLMAAYTPPAAPEEEEAEAEAEAEAEEDEEDEEEDEEAEEAAPEPKAAGNAKAVKAKASPKVKAAGKAKALKVSPKAVGKAKAKAAGKPKAAVKAKAKAKAKGKGKK
eukprot:CAMPEP_0115120084 /NCGR_PEP_ID=MMETSP0227-20121206/45475_1 /TAXON_ID=89957 /ORGANISM="Polarella glacialis, Strain CCMP 1383" /LENGTH=269 /DNA_ID=CAMNT_0002521675 /DNA_START=72 /DNA_END=881 /DNA_ORIENTATION=+